MIVRWGLGELEGVLAELGIEQPLLITTNRHGDIELPVEHRFAGARPHAEVAGVRAALAAAAEADGLVALGGGSTIDTAKAVSAERGLPVVSIPTTYSGAEWTQGSGSRDPELGRKFSRSGARTVAIVFEPRLTLTLPPGETVGTAMNALAHCAEGLYSKARTAETDRDAIAGARLISEWLPIVLADGEDLEARTRLLEGAMHAGAALRAGMGVGHAMAQALGGRFGVPHGAMNAICLPTALRFNAEAAAPEIARLGEAMRVADPIGRVAELSALGGFRRLRDFGIPKEGLPEVAGAAAERPGAKGNPRPAPADAILALYESVW